MEQKAKHLIRKFILNECSPEEIDYLVDYFQNKNLSEDFPKVDEVLALIEEKPELSEKDEERIYKEILERVKQKRLRVKREEQKRRRKYLALAAIFIGIIGAVFYFDYIDNNKTEKESSVAHKEKEQGIQLEMENGEIQTLTKDGQFELTNEEDEVLGSQNESKLVYNKYQKSTEEVKYNTLRIPFGERFEIELADGSTVFMNAGSSLKYPVRFPEEGKRKVHLTGEAYFDVSKDEDKERAFVVETKQMEIDVLGTAFNVSAYEEDEAHNVVLVEGVVEVANSDREEEESIQLKPGQLAEFNLNAKDGFAISEVDIELYTAWMRGELVFRNLSLERIFKQMERHYNITIVDEGTDLMNEEFNAKFGDEAITDILDYFHSVYGLEYTQKNKDTLIIEKENKQ